MYDKVSNDKINKSYIDLYIIVFVKIVLFIVVYGVFFYIVEFFDSFVNKILVQYFSLIYNFKLSNYGNR